MNFSVGNNFVNQIAKLDTYFIKNAFFKYFQLEVRILMQCYHLKLENFDHTQVYLNIAFEQSMNLLYVEREKLPIKSVS